MAEVALGRREALERLLRIYATPLLTFIQRMVGDHHRSEELFQEVFLAVWRKRQQYDYSRPFKTWLYAIAINKCRAAFRRPFHSGVMALEESILGDFTAPELSPAESAIATETANIVAQAVGLLPVHQRTVVVLRVWQQLSYAEIADVLGTTETTARSNMHHGLRTLRIYLEPRLGVL
jgi:RNA polymerase sigma-70 factor (ECF subfamily)